MVTNQTQRPRTMLLALVALGTAACGSTSPPSTPADSVDSSWVTANVAASLDGAGHYRVDALASAPAGELTRTEVETLGLAFVRSVPTRTGGVEQQVETEHGGPIDFGTLALCRRTFYLASAFATDAPPPTPSMNNALGGQYLSFFCDAAGRPAVLLQVASRTTARTVGALGGASDAFVNGIPLSRPDLIGTPEAATGVAAKGLHARVADVPGGVADLFAIGPIGGNGRPVGALWRLRLDRTVQVVGLETARQGTVSTVYTVAGYSSESPNTIFAPAAQPLAPFWFVVPHADGSADSAFVRPTQPLLLEPVRLSANWADMY